MEDMSPEATLQGGFLPIFWDVPKSTMHAVSDIGALVEWLQEHIAFGQDSTENLAVLHNQNHMVHEFGLSAWVTQSKRQVISRSVTSSCAGMTAYMLVVAQTQVGFLTGGRGEKFRSLPEEERRTQEEEAYARATVALTRARKMCVIFCPLDMKGLIGAATVMGSLMYGAGHCWNGMINMHLRHSSPLTGQQYETAVTLYQRAGRGVTSHAVRLHLVPHHQLACQSKNRHEAKHSRGASRPRRVIGW